MNLNEENKLWRTWVTCEVVAILIDFQVVGWYILKGPGGSSIVSVVFYVNKVL